MKLWNFTDWNVDQVIGGGTRTCSFQVDLHVCQILGGLSAQLEAEPLRSSKLIAWSANYTTLSRRIMTLFPRD